MDRETLKTEFLTINNLSEATRSILKKDASHRSYERIVKNDNSSVLLMDAPPEFEDVHSYVLVSKFLNNHRLSAPKIIATDYDNGFLLIEDFGNDIFSDIILKKSKTLTEISEEELYTNAVNCLIHLHKTPIKNIDLELYDETKLIKEAKIFIQFYLEVLNADRVLKSDQEEFTLIFKHLLTIANGFSKVMVLRDYHADNLMWLKDREGIKKVGILDFQDAVIGSPVYDLVSLLEDARVDVSQAIVDKMINLYLQAFPTIPRKEFMAAYSIFAIQRNLKIIGVFARQATLHKNHHYLSYLPRVWRHVNHDLKHPLLLPIKKWLEKLAPLQLKY